MINFSPSVNGCTPKELCSVHYNDLDVALKQCLLMSKEAEIINGTPVIYLGKTDLSNSFRVLPLRKGQFAGWYLKLKIQGMVNTSTL